MQSLFGGEASSLSAEAGAAGAGTSAAAPGSAAKPGDDLNALIAGAARDLADYRHLTAEGKLGEAGQKEPKIKVLSIAGLIARAIQSIHEETSVSKLFS